LKSECESDRYMLTYKFLPSKLIFRKTYLFWRVQNVITFRAQSINFFLIIAMIWWP